MPARDEPFSFMDPKPTFRDYIGHALRKRTVEAEADGRCPDRGQSVVAVGRVNGWIYFSIQYSPSVCTSLRPVTVALPDCRNVPRSPTNLPVPPVSVNTVV